MPAFERSARSDDGHRTDAWASVITLRLATADDAAALERLAQLETRAPTDGPHLVAARDGVVEAALDLRSGELIADPFRRTAELGTLLRFHAGTGLTAPSETPAQSPCLQTALAPA